MAETEKNPLTSGLIGVASFLFSKSDILLKTKTKYTMSYVIIKKVKMENKELPVILLDTLGEILSFETEEMANAYQELFQINSDSKHSYEVKHIYSMNEY